jgi:hypothetical protein
MAGLVLAIGACSFGGAPASTSPHGSAPIAPITPPGDSIEPFAAALRACPVTPPGGPAPPGAVPPAPHLGNGQIWAGLWPGGVVVVPPDDVEPDGFLRMKFMWVRGPGARGILHITGHEIGSGASVRARSAGYGFTGFNASSIFFPQEGCYRVTGKAGGAKIAFVTLVRTCRVFAQLPLQLRKLYSSWCRP